VIEGFRDHLEDLGVDGFAGSGPAEAVRVFQEEKILSTPSFGREVKLWVPCRRFMACNRSLNATCKSDIFRLNLPAISRPHSSPPLADRISRRRLVAKVGNA
jgi:peptidoglycan hydrolase-like protein with peptidoglycan-binding domain